jgi:hypothetical protein
MSLIEDPSTSNIEAPPDSLVRIKVYRRYSDYSVISEYK